MVNYPNGHKSPAAKQPAAGNAGGRGMELEKEITRTNEYYLSIDKAVVYKKPTPVTIVKVDYPDRSAAKITEAYFKLPSTTDYNGIYRGRYIDFEAKECKSKTSFPLKTIHPHQIKHLQRVIEHGGIGFVIIRFTTLLKTYYVPAKDLIAFIEDTKRSSIPCSWFEKYGTAIPFNYVKPVDYLAVIDRFYFEETTR